VSSLGDGVSFIAVPLLAATLTTSPALIAGLSLAYTLPRLLVSILSGALVDRMDRRLLMASVNLGRGVVMGALAALVAAGAISLATLYAGFVALGLLETVADTSAFSVLPTIVGPGDLDRANGRMTAAQIICDEFAGPPLGGLLFGVAAASPLLLDGGSFVLAAALFLLLRGNFAVGGSDSGGADGRARPNLTRELAEGLAWIARHRLLRTLSLMFTVTNLAYLLPFSVLVLFATGVLRLTPAGYGLMLAVSSGGGLAGSAAAPLVRRLLGAGRTIAAMPLIGAAAYLVIAVARSVVLVTLMLAVYFFQTVVWSITVASLRQALVPDALRGRAAGVNKTLGLLGLTVGSLGGGLLAGAYGMRAPWWCGAGLLAAAGIAAGWLVPGAVVERAEDTRPAPEPTPA
jgi:predicted MFS family arabinose efflux permease